MYDGIKRLRGVLARAAGAGEQPRTFWRGMGGARVTQEFMEQFTSKGGTEMAPMSTSDDEAVARHFAKWDEAACTDAVLTKVEDADHTCCGVDLAWLSMYAGGAVPAAHVPAAAAATTQLPRRMQWPLPWPRQQLCHDGRDFGGSSWRMQHNGRCRDCDSSWRGV